MKNKLILTIILTITVFIFFSKKIFACAPGFSIDIYESNDILSDYYPLLEGMNPDQFQKYPIFNQKFDVITPGWGSEYMLPVYIAGEGKNLSDDIKKKLSVNYSRPFRTEGEQLYREPESKDSETLPEKWKKLVNNYYEDIPDDVVIECSDQILERALNDYEYRKNIFTKEDLASWIRSQNNVFNNCAVWEIFPKEKVTKKQSVFNNIINFFKNLNKTTKLPENITASELLKYDREYHEAAGAYYKKDYSLASRLFNNIISNKSHPHRNLVALSLGWTYIGVDVNNYENDLKNEDKSAESNYLENLKKTQKYYENIVNNSEFKDIKYEAQKYLDFVIFRTDPARRLIEAENVLFNTNDSTEFARQLNDFRLLWYKYFQRVLINQKREPKHDDYVEDINSTQSPFLRFLLEWEKPTEKGIQYSLENYKKSNNPLWLILALRQSNENQKDFNFIREEINKIKPESPFYLTAQYYFLDQLTKNEKNKDEAKTLAEKFMKKTYLNNQLSAFNLYSDIRERLSDNPTEAFNYSIRYSLALYDENWDYLSYIPYYTYGNVGMNDSKNNPLLSNRSKVYLSTLNSSELTKFILDNTSFLKDSLERYIKLTVFDRLFVLGDTNSMDLIAENIVKTDNVMSPTFSQYITAKTNETKNFEAAKILVEYPEVYPQIAGHIDINSDDPINILKEINDYRTNWVSGFACLDERYKPDDFNPTQIDKEVADKKPINYLMATIVNYMDKNPSYTNPELLHKVVDVGHYATCQDDETSNIAKRAFQLLHSKYPGSYWAKQTPYWY